MKMAQERELLNIEEAQKVQFKEFTDAWDRYMRDYEVTAFELIEQLKVKQDQERASEEERIATNFISRQTGSKEINEMRHQEKIYSSVKDFDKAQTMRMMIEQQEMFEARMTQEKLQVTMQKEVEKLMAKQH
jgi:hypothetical protein